eukprot:s322_g14.t1
MLDDGHQKWHATWKRLALISRLATPMRPRPAREEDIKKLHKAFKKDASSSYSWHAGEGLHAGAVRVPVLPAGSEGIKSAQQQAHASASTLGIPRFGETDLTDSAELKEARQLG